MGLRRTPPPGVAPPAHPPSAPPPEFLSEFPPSPAPAPIPSTPAPTKETTPVKEAPPPAPTLPSPKLPSPKPPSPRLPRVTPRNSLFGVEDNTDKDTPHNNLVHLAKVVNRPPATPQRPTTSGGGNVISARRSVRRTPGAGRLNPLPPKLTARSPHAARAWAATPGRERRKSGRYPTARETPRDLLRALSNYLAPTSAPYKATPVPTPTAVRRRSSLLGHDRHASDILFYSDPGHEEASDDELPPAPKITVNLKALTQGDDDDDDIRPMQEPRFSVPLEDLDNTHHSIEYGRRAVSEQPWGGRYSFGRQSFGIQPGDQFVDFQALPEGESEGEEEPGNDTAIFGAMGEESMRIDLEDEQSEIGVVGEEEDEDEDITMGREVGFDEGESYFMQVPEDAPGFEVQHDTEGQTNGDYDIGGMNDTVSADSDSDIEVLSHNAPANPPSLKPHLKPTTKRKTKPLPISRHGISYPHFPRATIKKMAQTFSGGAAISNEALNAIVAASEAFFEQVSDDLAVYAGHAGRKTIEDVDVVQLLKRQRQITPSNTAFSLAQRYLPRELLQEVRMPLVKRRKGKKRELEVVDEEG